MGGVAIGRADRADFPDPTAGPTLPAFISRRKDLSTRAMSDPHLIAWGRARAHRGDVGLPVLWLFTDTKRLADPRPAARRLPVGISGVVLRHDDHPNRAAIGRDLRRICRQRRLVLVVAGDPCLAAALGAGVHLRGGFRPTGSYRPSLITSSAHNPIELRRAWRNGAGLVFLSPAFPTASHPGEPALGAVRWSAMARQSRVPVVALGGIDGANIRRLWGCAGVAAISALAGREAPRS